LKSVTPDAANVGMQRYQDFIKRMVNNEEMNTMSVGHGMSLNKLAFSVTALFILCFPTAILANECYDYKNSTDNLKTKVTFNNELHSNFFDSYEASYPWYIFRRKNGSFETALDKEITEEDKVPIEHTSNCYCTHQGNHIMSFCDATYESGALKLEIYGGMPAYFSSLMITVKGSGFLCHFKGAYPVPVRNCKWQIISKKLTFKDNDIKKGKRIYGWISVEFDETSTYQGETTTSGHKIEGYLKPIVK